MWWILAKFDDMQVTQTEQNLSKQAHNEFHGSYFVWQCYIVWFNCCQRIKMCLWRHQWLSLNWVNVLFGCGSGAHRLWLGRRGTVIWKSTRCVTQNVCFLLCFIASELDWSKNKILDNKALHILRSFFFPQILQIKYLVKHKKNKLSNFSLIIKTLSVYKIIMQSIKVILICAAEKWLILWFRHKPHWRAKSGQH